MNAEVFRKEGMTLTIRDRHIFRIFDPGLAFPVSFKKVFPAKKYQVMVKVSII